MQFESPWLLLGMLAAGIPVAIHLINRQRAKVLRFAAIEHLLLSDKRLARRLRVRQLLVLALRVLLMLAIPFALAKPYLEKDRLDAPDLGDPGAVVLVIDDSLSMQAIAPGGQETLLTRALAEAGVALDAGGHRTAWAVVAAGAPARLLTPGLTYDRQVVDRALARIEPTARAGDIAGALREAERVLASTEEPRRRVRVIGDAAAHAWAGVTEPWALSQPPRVDLIDVRDGAPIPNLAIGGVSLRPAPEVGPGHAHVEVRVTNHSAEPTEARITVELGGEQTVSTMTVAADSTEALSFVERLPEAGRILRGTATLTADALPADDRRYFTIDFGGTVQVAVVNGSPSSVPHLDELFFVRAALEAATGDRARVHAAFMAPDDLGARQLEHIDVVILANVGTLTSAQRIALRGWVDESGGGLLVTAGDQLTAASTEAYGDLLPYPIRAIKEVVEPDSPAAALTALRLGDVDFEHPALREFASVDDASLFLARTWTYALVDTAQRADARVLASFSAGQPALVEASVGRGRVMMLTTSADRDWSDLVIRTSFVPLLQEIAMYLAGRLDGAGSTSHLVGAVAEVPLPEGAGELVLERPDGTEVTLADPGADEEASIQVTDLDLAGHYTLRRRIGHVEGVAFAVNGDPAESDLALADPVRVAAALERAGQGTGPSGPAISDAGDEPPDSRRTRVWPVVLVGLFWLLASEAWLVIRG